LCIGPVVGQAVGRAVVVLGVLVVVGVVAVHRRSLCTRLVGTQGGEVGNLTHPDKAEMVVVAVVVALVRMQLVLQVVLPPHLHLHPPHLLAVLLVCMVHRVLSCW
jgi:hypothetical protein